MRTKDLIAAFNTSPLFYRAGCQVGASARVPIYGIRKLLPENFIPAAHTLVFSPAYYHNTVQILVKSIGGNAWINANIWEIEVGGN